MAKIKLIFFDMEGVIFESGISEKRTGLAASIWSIIPKLLGEECVKEEELGKKMWQEGKFKNYFEWCDYSIAYHKKYGLTMEKFYELINKVPYIKGAKETFAELKKKGYRTALVSGGFKNLANRAIRDLQIDHTFAACEYFFDEKTKKLLWWNLLPSDYEGKANFMELMIKEYCFKPEECAFVCDSVNDIPLAKKVGLSIAFNARKELQKVATHSVNQKEKDLRGILKFF